MNPIPGLLRTLLACGIALVWQAEAAAAAERAFAQIYVRDIAASSAWYEQRFGLRLVNLFSRPRFEQRIYAGPDLILELVQERPDRPQREKTLGLNKLGIAVDDLEPVLAQWRAAGFAFDPPILDEALGLATVLSRDPDGNIVQLFGRSTGRFAVNVGPSAEYLAVNPVPAQRVELAVGEWKLFGDFRRAERAGAAPAVLLLNKANGDRTAYAALASGLAARGISSLRLDLRGHGESINGGRFVPGGPAATDLLAETWRDIAAALAWLAKQPGVDSASLGIVGASYSSEAAMEALRQTKEPIAALVHLSPGSLSEDSAAAADASGARWLLVRTQRERSPSVRNAAAMLDEHSQRAEIWTLDGEGHATDMLAEVPGLKPRLADWLAAALVSPARADP